MRFDRTSLKTWLAPLVNLESTLLLFATFIFHHYYFGADFVAAPFVALGGGILFATTLYGAVVLLANLAQAPADWQEFRAFMVFLGSAWISMVYIAPFWMRGASAGWAELLAQVAYVLQATFSLTLVILLLTQAPQSRWAVTPRLSGAPGVLKSLLILVYVAGMTLFLYLVMGVAPEAVTAQVNLLGLLLLEAVARATISI
ncbi:MAG: hypothetical protein JW892_01485 [Anaerolineae bacterium]|nr:hypothetical protein [Anaerolineae bacterium]